MASSRVDTDSAPILDAIIAAGGGPRSGRWLDIGRAGDGAFLAADGGGVDWYVVGADHEAFSDLVEAVEAFVDTSFAVVGAAKVNPPHPYDVAAAHSGWASVRVAVPDTEQHAVDERMRLLADVWGRRPPRAIRIPRTTGRVLRDLDDALANGRLADAERLVAELREAGRLTSANLAFLEIRIAAAAGRWTDITGRRDIDDIAKMRLPGAVASTLIETLYHADVLPNVDGGAQELVDAFRARSEPVFSALFRDPSSAQTPEQRTVWMLHAAAMDPPSVAIRDEILDGMPAGAVDRALVETIAGLIASTQEARVDDEAQIDQFLRAGDLPAAWAAVNRSSLAQADRVRALLHIAYEGDRPDWAEMAVSEAAVLVDEDPKALAGRTPQMHLAELSALVSADHRPIVDWLSWLRALADHPEPQRLLDTARNQHQRWSVTSLASAPDAASLVLDVATSDPVRALVLRQARPLFLVDVCSQFDEQPESQARMAPLLAALAEVIASEERLGQHELSSVMELAERVLGVAVTADEYEAVVERGLRQVWLRASNARNLGWLADAVWLVARSASDHVRPRQDFLDVAAASVAALPTLHEEDRQALAEAFAFAGIDPELVPPASDEIVDDDNVWGRLAGQKTLIYTLVESAGARAQEFIKAHVPDADVVVSSERDADRRLVEHARRSDILIIATRAAKHAATTEIERQRRREASVVYPTGKGWSSIVGALRDVLRDR